MTTVAAGEQVTLSGFGIWERPTRADGPQPGDRREDQPQRHPRCGLQGRRPAQADRRGKQDTQGREGDSSSEGGSVTGQEVCARQGGGEGRDEASTREQSRRRDREGAGHQGHAGEEGRQQDAGQIATCSTAKPAPVARWGLVVSAAGRRRSERCVDPVGPPSSPGRASPSGWSVRVSSAQGRAGVRLSAATATRPGPAHPAVGTMQGTDLSQQPGEVGEMIESLIERRPELNIGSRRGQPPAGARSGVHADLLGGPWNLGSHRGSANRRGGRCGAAGVDHLRGRLRTHSGQAVDSAFTAAGPWR